MNPDIIPKAPETSDPIVWIAIVLVVGAVSAVFLLVRALREERREALGAFREEMAEQRKHDASQVAETHKRIDHIADEVADLAKEVASK